MAEKIKNTAHSIYRISLPTPFAVGDIHVYVVLDDVPTLIDVGLKTKEAKDKLEMELRSIGINVADIRQVVLTHHHIDHIGLLGALDFKDLTVLGHSKNEPWLLQDEGFFRSMDNYFKRWFLKQGAPKALIAHIQELNDWPMFAKKPEVLTFHSLKDQSYVPGLPQFTAYETPGHASSHLIFVDETEHLAIGGDLLLTNVSSNPLIEMPERNGEERPKALLDYRKSLQKCLDLHIERILPSHGEEIYDVPQLVERRSHDHEKKAALVLDYVKERPMTLFECCKTLFPRAYETQFLLTMSLTIGILDYLESKGELVVNEHDHLIYYRLK